MKKFLTIDQVKDAEKRSRGYIAHDDIAGLLEFLETIKATEVAWWKIGDTCRDIFTWVGIKPNERSCDCQHNATCSGGC